MTIIALILACNSDPQAPSTDKRGAKEVLYTYSANLNSLQLAGEKEKKRKETKSAGLQTKISFQSICSVPKT